MALNHVLGCYDQKRLGQRPPLAVGAYLTLSHRFQQGALGAGTGPVQLIGHDHVGKNGARHELKGLVTHVEDRRPGDVGWQQVRSELDPGELPIDGISYCLGQKCFTHSGEVIQQNVTLSKQPKERQVDVFL